MLVGRDATVTNVLAALGQCDVLHVCAHATADQERRQVGIRLHDGDLGVREILSMATVVPRLIVANTCISGVSMRESPNGDQPLSLPTAALIRGTQSVVGTLWKVRDDVAGEDVGVGINVGRRPARLHRDGPQDRGAADRDRAGCRGRAGP